MNSKVVNEILSYLNQLGKAISKGAEQSFQIIVRQQFALGVVDTMICGLIMLLALGGMIASIIGAVKVNDWEDTSIGLIVVACICGVIAFIDLFCLGRSILHMMNPAFFAIQYILNTIANASGN